MPELHFVRLSAHNPTPANHVLEKTRSADPRWDCCSAVLPGSIEWHRLLKNAGGIENADLPFAKAAPLMRVVERALFRIRSGEIWLHARRFERLPAAAVRPDFDDALNHGFKGTLRAPVLDSQLR